VCCLRNFFAGFLSIDCGALAAYTDPILNISWVPDSPYITTGLNSANATSNIYTTVRYKTVRYFPEPRSKHCYVLPATFNETYLLRTTFLYGDYDGGAARHTFHLTVDTYDAGEVYLGADNSDRVIYEITLVATAANIYVCLVPDVVGVDVPFISFLELRSLGIGELYPKANGGYYLFTMYRENFGSDTSLRYASESQKLQENWFLVMGKSAAEGTSPISALGLWVTYHANSMKRSEMGLQSPKNFHDIVQNFKVLTRNLRCCPEWCMLTSGLK
jgi:hypothetical protein